MKAISKGRRVFWGNTVWQYVLQSAKYRFPLITLPYLTRVLGPDTYAVRVYVVSAMTIAQVVLDYGFTTYGARVVALNRTKKEKVGALCCVIVTLRIGLSLLTYLSILAISAVHASAAILPLLVILGRLIATNRLRTSCFLPSGDWLL